MENMMQSTDPSLLSPAGWQLHVEKGEGKERFIKGWANSASGMRLNDAEGRLVLPGLDAASVPGAGPYGPHVLTLFVRSEASCRLRLLWNDVLVRNVTLFPGQQRVTVRLNSFLIRCNNVLTTLLPDHHSTLRRSDGIAASPELCKVSLEGGVSNKEWALRHFLLENGRLPDENLSTFNDVIYHRQMELWNTDLSAYTDKLRLRDLVSETFNGRYLVPIQGVYCSPQEIDWPSLAYPCVVKSNHSSGQVLRLDGPPGEPPQHLLENWLRQDYAEFGETCYQGITPHLYVEDCLNPDGAPLIDYKFHCFGGKAKSIAVILGRPETGKPCMTHYSPQWEPQRFTISNDLFTGDVPRPAELEEMLHIAETLAAPFKYVRVDLYDVAGKIYVGELTFFHYGGVGKISSPFWDRWLAECYHSVSKSELL